VDSLTEEDKWHIRQILKGNIPAPDDTWKMGAELWETSEWTFIALRPNSSK
jgi:hypothetical protein